MEVTEAWKTYITKQQDSIGALVQKIVTNSTSKEMSLEDAKAFIALWQNAYSEFIFWAQFLQ